MWGVIACNDAHPALGVWRACSACSSSEETANLLSAQFDLRPARFVALCSQRGLASEHCGEFFGAAAKRLDAIARARPNHSFGCRQHNAARTQLCVQGTRLAGQVTRPALSKMLMVRSLRELLPITLSTP